MELSQLLTKMKWMEYTLAQQTQSPEIHLGLRESQRLCMSSDSLTVLALGFDFMWPPD